MTTSSNLRNPAMAPVWPGPCLMVPMTIDCLLVGEPDRTGSTWAATAFNYYNLANGALPDAPDPFTAREAPLVGAHLMWTLPYGLRHGQQVSTGPDAGAIDFPLVPNRWLVLRVQYGAPGTSPTLTAGVIQADLLTALSTESNSPSPSQFPDPANPNDTKQIGTYFPLEDWQGPAGPAKPFLRAVGPGEISWAVAYDNIRNVFAFHDALPVTAGTYSYMVIGWYADPATDPLYTLQASDPAAWQEALAQGFGWSVGQTPQDVLHAQSAWSDWQKSHGLDTSPFDPAKLTLPPQLLQALTAWVNWQTAQGVTGTEPLLPRQTLCHGVIAQVIWNGSESTYGSGVPGGGQVFPEVSIGNTAAEALAAWLAQRVVQEDHGAPDTIPILERAIEAFQKGLLLQLERDPVATEANLQAARFEANFGGAQWLVVRPGAGENPNSFSGQATIPLDVPQTQALSELNAHQGAHDQLAARLISQQSEMFALSYKGLNLPRSAPQELADKIEKSIAAIQSAITASRDRISTLKSAIDAARTTLLGLLGSQYELRVVNANPAYAPNDPVLMLAGVATDTKLAAPGTYDEAQSLFCRVTGQTVTGLTISYPINGQSDPITLRAADLLGSILLPTGQPIPKEAQDLWLELLFLDTGAASFLAGTYFARQGVQPSPADLAALTQLIQKQQMAPWTAQEVQGVALQAAAQAAGFEGVLPDPVAVFFRGNHQPWTPIYIDWRVSWFPSARDPAGQVVDWRLDSTDYVWKGSSVTPPPNSLIFQGRTVLNPKIAQDIASQFAQFHDDPDYAELDQFIRDALDELAAIMSRFDVVTQSMGGFTQQLVTRMIAPNQDSSDPQLRSFLDGAPIGFRPIPGGSDFTLSLPFFPIRAGHLQVLDLWVVDSFGQILRGKDPALGADAPIPNLIRAQSLTTPGQQNTSYVQLPPRISQPAHVTLQLTDAKDDSVPINSADRTSPICGWIMPNHLDSSLMVFDAQGGSLGSVLKVQTDAKLGEDNTGLRWDAPPGSDAPLGALPENIDNPHLQGFIRGLLAQGRLLGGAALDTLLDHIDSALWRLSPLGLPDRNISALMGPPLAVVRARLSMSLDGMPVYNQSWADTGKYYLGPDNSYTPVPPPVLSVPMGVRIGDLGLALNGVMGYFTSNAYNRFYAVYGAGGETAALRRALRRGPLRRGKAAELLRATVSAPPLVPGYVETDHLVELRPDGRLVDITLVVDPRGMIPVISGVQPVCTLALAPGPVSEALHNMTASFRVGPLLIDPRSIRMPLPSEVQGNWAWTARTDVAGWGADVDVATQDAVARFGSAPLRLSEGWLILSGALGSKVPKT